MKAEELEQKAEKVFAWLNDILRKRINLCEHSLGEESVYIQSFCVIIIMLHRHVNLDIYQRCYLSLESKLLTVGEAKPVEIQTNRILQTPLLIHFARNCQQPRLS